MSNISLDEDSSPTVVRFRVSGEAFDIPMDELARWKDTMLYAAANDAIAKGRTEESHGPAVPIVTLADDVQAFRQIRHYMRTGEISVARSDLAGRQILWHAANMYQLTELAAAIAVDAMAAPVPPVTSAKPTETEEKKTTEVGKAGARPSDSFLRSIGVAPPTDGATAREYWHEGKLESLLEADARIRDLENQARAVFGRGEDGTRLVAPVVLLSATTETEHKARHIAPCDDGTQYSRFEFPRPKSGSRRPLLPKFVDTFQAFSEQFDVLSDGAITPLLSELPIVAAGGSVLAALHRLPRVVTPAPPQPPEETPIPEEAATETKREAVPAKRAIAKKRLASKTGTITESIEASREKTATKHIQVLSRLVNRRSELTAGAWCTDLLKCWLWRRRLIPQMHRSDGEVAFNRRGRTPSYYTGSLKLHQNGDYEMIGRGPVIKSGNRVVPPLAESYRIYESLRQTDVDLFITTTDPDEATNAIMRIHAALEAAWGSECIRMLRTCHAVTFIRTDSDTDEYTTKIQIILRLYKSVEHVLLGFDVDCCCVAYDGKRVLATARGLRALETKTNIVNPSRQSTSYESRLLKYARRGFAIAVPGFTAAMLTEQRARALESIGAWKLTGVIPSLVGVQLLIAMLYAIAEDRAARRLFRMAEQKCDYDVADVCLKDVVPPYIKNTRTTGVVGAYTGNADGCGGDSMTIRDLLFSRGGRPGDVPECVEFVTDNPHKQDRVDVLFTGSFCPTNYDWFRGTA
ncbi:MAG: hypothetical protein KGL39_09270 [Patescibacteria group bacterium]|nr:hypothetical protein [Patescibacteria group bacterium]